jgi:outer membrane protein assembly factor BamB
VRFRFAFGQRGPTVNAATPLVCDGNLFVTASYGVGAVMAAIGEKEAKTIWKGPDAISSQYATSLYVDGVLYGSDGRADQPPVHLKAVDAKTGRVLWSEEDYGVAHLIYADGRAIAVKEDGALILWKPSAKKFEQLAMTGKGSTTRALPALAGGRLFVRDDKALRCYQVGAPP